MSAVSGTPPPAAAGFDHFLVRRYPPYVAALAELGKLRVAENTLIARVPEIMVMEEMRQPRPTHRLDRGAYDAPRELVPRDTPASLPPFPANQPRNRLGLARWLTDRGNPLTARVVVNRIWRMHFGRGIVATQEDFGSQGRLPTHPELLDFLADRFVKSGWDVKALHRLIVTSEAFQQTSLGRAGGGGARSGQPVAVARTEAAAGRRIDPRQRARRERPAESHHRRSQRQALSTGRTLGTSRVPGKTYKQDSGGDLYRRSLYTFWRRTSPPPSMTTFDAMSREVCTAKREVTTTPLQSLVLLNDPQFVEAARRLAEHALGQSPADAAARNRLAFRALIGRAPDDTEAGILGRIFAEQRAWFAAHPGDASKAIAVGESKPERRDRSRRARGDDHGGERDHELRRVRGDEMRSERMSCDKCVGALPAAGLSRRAVLNRFGMGLGGIAVANLVNPAGLAAFAGGGQDRGLLNGRFHVPPKAKRVIYLFMAGGPSQMETFDYKPVLNQRNGEQLPDSVRQGQRLTGHVGQSVVAAARRVAIRLRAARRRRHLGQQPAAAYRARHRRSVRRPIDEHRRDQSRSGDHVLPERIADRRPAEHGGVDSLRPGQRQRRSPRLRRPDHAGQGRSAAVFAALGQRVPAVGTPGRAVSERP